MHVWLDRRPRSGDLAEFAGVASRVRAHPCSLKSLKGLLQESNTSEAERARSDMHSDSRYPKFELFRVDALLVAMMPHFRQTDRTESHDLPKRSRSQGVLSSTCDKGPCNENGADSPGGHVTLVRSEPLRRRRETTERRRSQSRSASAHIVESRDTTGRDWSRGPDNELVCSIFHETSAGGSYY